MTFSSLASHRMDREKEGALISSNLSGGEICRRRRETFRSIFSCIAAESWSADSYGCVSAHHKEQQQQQLLNLHHPRTSLFPSLFVSRLIILAVVSLGKNLPSFHLFAEIVVLMYLCSCSCRIFRVQVVDSHNLKKNILAYFV